MQKTLRQMIIQREEANLYRPSFLASPFMRETRLEHILADPKRYLDELMLTPRVGEVSVARLRRSLVEEFARMAPGEWRAAAFKAGEAPSRAAQPDPELTARFRRFRKTWHHQEESHAIRGAFHKAYTNPDNAVLTRALTEGKPFVYAPESLPEPLKMDAVFAAEQGRSDQKDAYLAHLARVREDYLRVPEGSLVVMDRLRLENLARGQGAYAALDPSQISAQLGLLEQFSRLLQGLTVRVVEFRKHGLSSGFATRSGPLYHYCFGGYLELRSAPLITQFWDQAECASAAGEPFDAWLAVVTGNRNQGA